MRRRCKILEEGKSKLGFSFVIPIEGIYKKVIFIDR